MEIFLYKKHLIENCEKNYKQTCSKQKIAYVSSVNESHKINTSFRVRNVLGRSKMASNPSNAWYYFMYGTQIVSRKTLGGG